MKEDNLLPKGTPMLDASDKDFKEQLDFALWSEGGSSDYRNDRERPYNGQPHTDQGKRGETIIEGLTMRDLADCMVQGFLRSSMDPEIQDKVVEISDDPDIGKGTKYAAKNTWRYQDMYLDKGDLDPRAVIQNTVCMVEQMMGIFPNVGHIYSKES